jgi:hypothetical protein
MFSPAYYFEAVSIRLIVIDSLVEMVNSINLVKRGFHSTEITNGFTEVRL